MFSVVCWFSSLQTSLSVQEQMGCLETPAQALLALTLWVLGQQGSTRPLGDYLIAPWTP